MRLGVMVVDQDPGRGALLEQALVDNHYVVLARLSSSQNLLAEVARLQPDIILIDMDSPDRDTLESLRTISHHQPKPIIMFAEKSDQKTITDAVRAGVSAYVVDGLSSQRLNSIMQVAIARFREFQALRRELEETKTKLADRKDVEKAKGLLAKQKDLSEDEAYKALRKMAMTRNITIGEAARNLIAAAELLI